jgi:Flp pilus assembly protein CpaB
MAVTEVDVTRQDEPRAAPRSRRRVRGRISAGHWLMIVAGLLAGLLNVAILRGGDTTVRVAVAAQEITPGQVIGPDLVRYASVSAEDALLAALVPEADVESVFGAVATSRIGVGEPLTRSAVDRGATGLRTMSIPIDPAHAAGGGLQPGDRVDVIAVEGGGAAFIALDLEVVAVADRGPGALGAVGAYHVSVLVEAETALHVALAMRTSNVELVRSTGAAAVPDGLELAPAEETVGHTDSQPGP